MVQLFAAARGELSIEEVITIGYDIDAVGKSADHGILPVIPPKIYRQDPDDKRLAEVQFKCLNAHPVGVGRTQYIGSV
jgi:hypothetical protein